MLFSNCEMKVVSANGHVEADLATVHHRMATDTQMKEAFLNKNNPYIHWKGQYHKISVIEI